MNPQQWAPKELWTKGEQYVEVVFNSGVFEVIWGNDDTGDLDVLDIFIDQLEAIKYAEKWIVDREDS